MEQNCVMRDESAPLLHSKIVAAAPPGLHRRVDGDNDDNNEKFLLSSSAGAATAGKSTADNNNLATEQLQNSSSSSSSLTYNDPKFPFSYPNSVLSKKDTSVRDEEKFLQAMERVQSLRKPYAVRDDEGRRERVRRRINRRWPNLSPGSLSTRIRLEERKERIHEFRKEPMRLCSSFAPYNTTQFLMEEHQGEVDEEELVHPRRKRGDSFNSCDWFGDVCNSSSFEDDEYLHAQFCAEYDSVALERLHAMNKAELVHEYLLLEGRIDSLEEELKVVIKAKETDQPMEIQATEEDIAKIAVFQQEINKLLRENRRLQFENDIRQQNVAVAPGAAAAAAAVAEESISVDDQ